MLRIVAAIAALAIGATVVLAQNAAVIEQRKAAMKANAGATKDPSAMAKGDAPFDLPKVQASLKVFQDQATKLKTLFPDDSKTGAETRALPSVWEKKADFLGRLDKFAADAKAAAEAVKDEASFKAEWPKLIANNCVACHKEYQKPLAK
jgi:cytochrome c556